MPKWVEGTPVTIYPNGPYGGQVTGNVVQVNHLTIEVEEVGTGRLFTGPKRTADRYDD